MAKLFSTLSTQKSFQFNVYIVMFCVFKKKKNLYIYIETFLKNIFNFIFMQ